MSTATSPLAPPAPAANPATRAEQELLLRHLADDVRGRLAGDHPDRKVIRHRRPSQELQLGILPPLPQPDPDGHETPEQLARRINRPPSQIGVNFNLVPNGDEAAIDVAASFSFYVQRYPELDEQRAQAGQQQSAADDTGTMRPAVPLPGDDAGTGSDANGPRQAADGADGTAVRRTAPPPPRAGRRRRADGSSDLAEVWERFDIVTDRLPVVLDLTQGSRGSVRIPLDTAIAPCARRTTARPQERLPLPRQPAAAERRHAGHRRRLLAGHS